MNERIYKLAEQAKKYALDEMIKITDRDEALKIYSDCYDAKFAELMVRECTSVVDNLEGSDYIPWVSVAIKKHFGFEE